MQKEEYQEVKETLKPESKVEIRKVEEKPEPESEKTDAEISLEFLEEYRKLTRKYKRDFMMQPPQIVKLLFTENQNGESDPSI